MEYRAPGKCPVCGKSMSVAKLSCKRCGSEISGNFTPCKFCRLEEKDMSFLVAFIRNRGSIKDVEKELGLSYPTIRNMLDHLIEALGLDAGNGGERLTKIQILDKLNSGDIDIKEAASLLKGLKNDGRD